MANVDYYKSRLRNKGQVTLPSEVRKLLSVSEGEDLIFRVNENGQVVGWWPVTGFMWDPQGGLTQPWGSTRFIPYGIND